MKPFSDTHGEHSHWILFPPHFAHKVQKNVDVRTTGKRPIYVEVAYICSYSVMRIFDEESGVGGSPVLDTKIDS